jgi:NADH dehydrogenase
LANEIHAVTGAFGYSGRYIAKRLLDEGKQVVTLTNSSPSNDPFNGQVKAYPLGFGHYAQLVQSLAGVRVLYNTYWVRFNHQNFNHHEAVENTKELFDAAKEAGVERVVHVSITNPSLSSPLEYFHGKAELEETLIESGMSYAILRPTVIFGKEDILINNIAWVLRRLPVFGVFGKGDYKLQPIYVGDMADLAVSQGKLSENVIIDAIGPETFTYRELVSQIGEIIGKRRPIIGVSPTIGYATAWVVSKWVKDLIITKPEIEGLMANLLVTHSPPAGPTKLTEWARANKDTLGVQYASELARRRPRA